jgi:hypothetical protein
MKRREQREHQQQRYCSGQQKDDYDAMRVMLNRKRLPPQGKTRRTYVRRSATAFHRQGDHGFFSFGYMS